MVKPRSQQGPKAFHRLHVQFVKAIAVIISCLFLTAITHTSTTSLVPHGAEVSNLIGRDEP